MSKKLYLDESGECSFSEESVFKHFLITVLSIDTQFSGIIKSKLKRQFAKIINNGWNKNEEIKASALYYYGKVQSIMDILQTLLAIKSLDIHYIIINKHKINNQSFRNSSYGISYNYFTKIILTELIFQDNFLDIDLIYDLRNKETHAKKHFKQYLETEILGLSLENEKPVTLSIEGIHSKQCYGLMAVDFFSWSVYRKFEYGDDRFYTLLANNLGRKREWYLDK